MPDRLPVATNQACGTIGIACFSRFGLLFGDGFSQFENGGRGCGLSLGHGQDSLAKV